MWHCQPTACDFCLENDGAVVEAGEAFPNGAMTPDDCHRFCMCSATELAVPDDVRVGSKPSKAEIAGLIALYAIGYLASRHERDVAAQRDQDTDLIDAYFDGIDDAED